MPLPDVDPHDFEYMNHDVEKDKPFGPFDGDKPCGERSKERHDHPQWGPQNRWRCYRPKGHLGRHEAFVSHNQIAASWADKPE